MALELKVLPDESCLQSTTATLPFHLNLGYITTGLAKSLWARCELPLTSCQHREKVDVFFIKWSATANMYLMDTAAASLNMSRFHQALLVLSSAKRSSNGPTAEALNLVRRYENILIFSFQTKKQNWIITWHFVSRRNKRNSRWFPGAHWLCT